MDSVRTRHLTLRPLTDADVSDERVLRWHTDPEGYHLMGQDPRSRAEAAQTLRAWRQQWIDEGCGYWLAERDGHPVGIGGVRPMSYDGVRYLNLYYRLAPEARGAGLATEIAQAATSYALERHRWRPVVARIAVGNEPSLRTVRRAGMCDLGPFRMPQDRVDEPDNLLFQSPAVRLGVGDVYDEVVDLWCRVNASGGAVGWEGATDRDAVATVLDGHLAADGSMLVRLHAPTIETFDHPESLGPLLGFGFVQQGTWFSVRHRATLYRVMTDPDLRGRYFGQLLMAALHGVARDNGVEICEIGYRGGTGLERFYAHLGYAETGRVIGGLRFSWGDEDDIAMARRL